MVTCMARIISPAGRDCAGTSWARTSVRAVAKSPRSEHRSSDRRCEIMLSPLAVAPRLLVLALQLHLLVRRERDQVLRVEAVLGEPWPDAAERPVVHDGREHHAVDRELLDLVEER